MNYTSANDIVENLLPALAARLLNEDEKVTSAMAGTNAVFDEPEDIELKRAHFVKGESGIIRFEAHFVYNGSSADEAPWCGDQVHADVSGEYAADGVGWVPRDIRTKNVHTNANDHAEA